MCTPMNTTWNPQTKFRADFDKVKCLEIVLTPGKFLFIPAYWWYSIEFGKETSVASFKYKTYMNTVSILPHLVMKLLQNQNVKHNTIAKVADVETKVFEKEENAIVSANAI